MRTVALAVGFVCAVTASITIFVTENPEYLRIGILVALWGFVFAALAAGRRQTEQVMAASTEVDLRKNYELELEREVAARREYELRLEAQLRREVQEDFSSQVRALHEEMVRLRRELSEQWDSELRVERMVMRTQSVRMGGDRGESLTLGDTVADSADGPVQSYEVEEMRQILAEAITRMPEREKVVLMLYYYEGMTLAEIGQVLGVTESRVCQIHTKAVIHLRSKIVAAEREPA